MMWTADKDGSFNTQPPEGGWQARLYYVHQISVSTHSRPKAAGHAEIINQFQLNGFNTQPPEGGWVWVSRKN